MIVQDRITEILRQALAPEHLEVLNESDGHNVPRGSETHFKVVIVCSEFDGKSAVQRHRTVYSLLADELAGPVHALALHTYSPTEWLLHVAAPESPACLGGGGS